MVQQLNPIAKQSHQFSSSVDLTQLAFSSINMICNWSQITIEQN